MYNLPVPEMLQQLMWHSVWNGCLIVGDSVRESESETEWFWHLYSQQVLQMLLRKQHWVKTASVLAQIQASNSTSKEDRAK